jgi:hypothetical protein
MEFGDNNYNIYTEQDLYEIKKISMIGNKLDILLDSLDAIQVLSEAKFDIENKIVEKISKLIDLV